MIVNLSSIGVPHIGRIDGLSVDLVPPKGALQCVTKVDSFNLLSPYKYPLPAYVNRLKKVIESWGGAFTRAEFERDQVEVPQVHAYAKLPYWFSRPANYKTLDELGRDLEVPFSLPLIQEDVSYAEEGDKVANDIPPNHRLLRWKLMADINDDVRLLIKSGYPSLGDPISVFVRTDKGKVFRRDIRINQSTPLTDIHARIKDIDIVTPNSRSISDLKLSELVLFQPKLVSSSDAFFAPVPNQWRVPLSVVNRAELRGVVLRPGHIEGKISPRLKKIKFTTELSSLPHGATGLHLRFVVPFASMIGDKCFLKLTFNWTDDTFDRYFCSDATTGEAYVPLAYLFGSQGSSKDGNSLKSITWEILKPNYELSESQKEFLFEFALLGASNYSAADKLGRLPVIRSLDNAGLKQIKLTKLGGDFKVLLEPKAFRENLSSRDRVFPLEGELFKITGVSSSSKISVRDATPKQLSILSNWGVSQRGWRFYLLVATGLFMLTLLLILRLKNRRSFQKILIEKYGRLVSLNLSQNSVTYASISATVLLIICLYLKLGSVAHFFGISIYIGLVVIILVNLKNSKS